LTSKPDAQNAFARALLTFIGEEQELRVRGVEPGELRGKKIRRSIVSEFDSQCVYCDKKLVEPKEMQLDHLVSMNKDNVGLQIYGNLVLSCPPCNSAKKDRDFAEFLRETRPGDCEKIIERLTNRRVDFGANIDVSVIKHLVQQAYVEIGSLLDNHIDEALKLLAKPSVPEISRSETDYAEVASIFPVRSSVKTTTDSLVGEVIGYSMQGPKGKRDARVRFKTGDGRKFIRARSNLVRIEFK
jgi:hypothetical protein